VSVCPRPGLPCDSFSQPCSRFLTRTIGKSSRAAIVGHCEVTLAQNLIHFPKATLAASGLEAQHRDEFLAGCICNGIWRILWTGDSIISRMARFLGCLANP
jgi:hypothetical protein